MVGPEKTGETFRTEDFLRPIQSEEKQEFERLFPLRGKDVRVEHRGIFAYQKDQILWHVELTDVWHVALGSSETAFLNPALIMYQVKLTTENHAGFDVVYLE